MSIVLINGTVIRANARNGRGLHGESHSRLGSVLVSGIPALRLFGDPRCPIVPMVRLFLNVAALLIIIALIAPMIA